MISLSGLTFAGVGGHKSKSELAQMTPEQRVEEACREYVRHAYVHSDYWRQLEYSITSDGLKAVPQLARTVDEYDPTRTTRSSAEKDARCYAAEGLLAQLDMGVVRLRGTAEGKQAIESLRQLLERMQAAHFDMAGEGDAKQSRYESTRSHLNDYEGLNPYDEVIKNSLKLKYGIVLTEKQFRTFIDHLAAKQPDYPSWSEAEEYKDVSQRNAAGYALWFHILKTPEPIYKAFLQYQKTETNSAPP